MFNQDALVHRRRLRVALRKARQTRGLSQKDVATRLDWSPSKLLRIENGAVSVDTGDLRHLLSLYGVSDETEVEQLVAVARDARGSTRWAVYRDVLAPEFAAYLSFEGASSLIRQYQPSVVPGLLQTEEYAVEIIRALSPRVPSHTAKRALEARMERQELMRRPDRPEMYFILDEAALRRRVGSGQTMVRQLDRLVELSQLPRVNLQVMLFERGAYACMQGAFVVLEFADVDDDDLLYRETDSGLYLCYEGVEEVAKYTETFVELEDAATPKGQFPEIAAAIAAAG
jgi:transcriptional regulator with XRE-family HTH domain